MAKQRKPNPDDHPEKSSQERLKTYVLNREELNVYCEGLYPQIYAYIRKRVWNEEDVEDITLKTLDAFAKAAKRYGYIPTKGLAFSIAYRKYCDFYRHQSRLLQNVDIENADQHIDSQLTRPIEESLIASEDRDAAFYELKIRLGSLEMAIFSKRLLGYKFSEIYQMDEIRCQMDKPMKEKRMRNWYAEAISEAITKLHEDFNKK